MRVTRSIIVGMSLVVLLAPGAFGQAGNAGQGMFARDRNVSVMERPRPEYETRVIQAGAFVYKPQLNLALEYTDNVFAAASQEEEDFVAVINPQIAAQSTWSRHGFSADASVTRREYLDFTDESVWNYNVGALGQLDVVRDTFFTLGANYASLTEPRTSAGAAGQAAEPIEYDTGLVAAAFERTVNRVRVRGDVDYSTMDYDDAPLFGGGFAEQDFRDRDQIQYKLRGDYAISPDTALFARVKFNEREYDLSPPDVAVLRDSDGYTIEGGADFDLGGIARGAVAVGYMEQRFDSPVFQDIDGLSVDALVEWFPTQLTTVTFIASRGVQDAAIAGAAGYLNTNFTATVDHEVRRNVILSGTVQLSEDDYDGVDRLDERVNYEIAATYFLNRNLGLRASVNHFEQESSGAAGNQDYELNRVAVSLVWSM